jgi:trigger factor
LEKEIADDVRRSIKARFILDQFAEQEGVGVEEDEVGRYVTQLAYQQGVAPDQFIRQLSSSGQLAAVVADVVRSKAADLLAARVKVTDESGRKVEIAGRDGDSPDADAADAADAPDAAGETGAAGAEGQQPEGAEAAEPDETGKRAKAAASGTAGKDRAAKRGAKAGRRG